MGPVGRVPMQLWRLSGPSVFGPVQHCSNCFCNFFARHCEKLNLRAKRKEKERSKWVKQGCGNNGILRRDWVKNFKWIGNQYPPQLRSPQLFGRGFAYNWLWCENTIVSYTNSTFIHRPQNSSVELNIISCTWKLA